MTKNCKSLLIMQVLFVFSSPAYFYFYLLRSFETTGSTKKCSAQQFQLHLLRTIIQCRDFFFTENAKFKEDGSYFFIGRIRQKEGQSFELYENNESQKY